MKFIQTLIGKIDAYFSRDDMERIEQLQQESELRNAMLNDKGKAIEEKEIYIQELEKELDKLKEKFLPTPLELYWNNKRKKVFLQYPARHMYGKATNSSVDPRIFFVNEHHNLPAIYGKSNDEKAMNALKTVISLISYETDTKQFKRAETWLLPFETIQTWKGDCEDGAILLANMMLKAGIPYWRIRLNAGNVQGGGHAWVTYLRESDDEWYVLDWCYWPESSIRWKKWKNAEKYFDIWFSFNKKYIFKDENLDRDEITKEE